MSQSTALRIIAARQCTCEETNAAKETAPFLKRNQEDLCLAQCVERALRATGYGSLRGIKVTVRGRLVILGGRVPSYYLKQVAQTTALAVPGALHVRNGLDVCRRQPLPSGER